MIPSRNWFPQSLQERAAWYANFRQQFDLLAVSLGFLPGEIGPIEGDDDVMTFLAGTQVEIDGFADAVRQYRILIT